MAYIIDELNQWAIDKIKNEYAEDVCLLIGCRNWKIKPDGEGLAFYYFIPCTERGYNLAETFVIDGIGYDLFPMSWERVEGLAKINEGLTNCLGDGVVLYAKSDKDKKRFEDIQKSLLDNLSNKEYAYYKALEKVETAMELYKNMLFEPSLCNVRKAAGFIAQYLSQGIATINETYFHRGPENQIKVLNELNKIPTNFTALYEQLMGAKTLEETRNISYQMISSTRDFFMYHKPEKVEDEVEHDYEHLADWYEEATYTFRRIYYYCDEKDIYNSYFWAFNFQHEVDYLHREFDMKKMELISVYDSSDLSILRKRAEEVEKYIVSVIEENGVIIQSFNNLEEFLQRNK